MSEPTLPNPTLSPPPTPATLNGTQDPAARTPVAWGALALLLSMPALAAFCVLAVQLYLGVAVDPLSMLMVAGLALFTYALNGLSDGAEDAVNDQARAATLRRTGWWTMGVSSLALLVGGRLLALDGRLHALYPALLAIGVAYSFPIIPWPQRGRITWVRLKSIIVVKNLTIGVVWASAIFLVPLMDSAGAVHSPAALAVVGISYGILAVQNSIFCDMRDEFGDRQAGVRTLAVLYGASRCFTMTFTFVAFWCGVILLCLLAGVVDLETALMLISLQVLYPLGAWHVTRRFALHRQVGNAFIESSDVFFAVVLILLSG